MNHGGVAQLVSMLKDPPWGRKGQAIESKINYKQNEYESTKF